MNLTYPFETTAIRVVQPLGVFYVAVLPAQLVLQVARTDRLRAERKSGGGYELKGTQREKQDKRLSIIAGFLDRGDASFPNAIILAANYNFDLDVDQGEADAILDEERGLGTTNDSELWFIKESADNSHLSLIIPTERRLAAIIDGQHRLFALAKTQSDRSDMGLICSIFIDLPKAYQAQLFATINSTQKPVDRSLTYELFGYNIGEETEGNWTPDKLAVYFTRRLGTLDDSPMFGRIKVAPKRDVELQRIQAEGDWAISTAVVVDGILRLISSNPKRDSNLMNSPDQKPRRVLRNGPKDKSPLRELFLDLNDALIYQIVANYLAACNKVFWDHAGQDSFIRKTVGVQALFDILRKIVKNAVEERNVSVLYFLKALEPASNIDFSDMRFKVAAGAGRSTIRQAIEESLGL